MIFNRLNMFVVLTFVFPFNFAVSADSLRYIYEETIIESPLSRVWNAWTTNDGVKSFFAPDCNVEARLDGPYEIYFLPDADPGFKGSDSMTVK